MIHYFIDLGLAGFITIQYLWVKNLEDKYRELRYQTSQHIAGMMTLQEKPEKTPGM